MKFQCEFVHLEQPTIYTCGLTNVGHVLEYCNHSCKTSGSVPYKGYSSTYENLRGPRNKT